MKQSKKESTLQVYGMPTLGGVNCNHLWIEIPTVGSIMLNWHLFGEQFQAAVHKGLQLGEVDKLTYLWDSLKDGPAKNIIEGLIQTAESYQEVIRCLNDRYNHPRLTYCELVRRILQAPPLKANNGREL